MNNLVFVENGQAVTDSLTVAEVFGKEHKHVVRDIKSQIEKLIEADEETFVKSNFGLETFTANNHKEATRYTLTEDAFTLVAMSYITPEAMKFKIKFIQEFKRMREELSKQLNQPKSQAEVIAMLAQYNVEQERKLKALEMETVKQSSRIEQIENKIEKRMTNDFSMQLVTPTQIGNMFEPALSGKQINNLLRKAGLQWRVGGEWIATVDGKKYSSSEPVQLPNGRMTYQLKWQRRVKELIQGEIEVIA
jgi:Rha family phage regulatory protein